MFPEDPWNNTAQAEADSWPVDQPQADFTVWVNSVRTEFHALSPDIITVQEMPQKEGILFKHTNYLVHHLIALPDTDATNDRKVVRRYSDFVWLQEVLLAKYAFRLLPELPPKKLTSNADPLFLERRRRGLARYLNHLMRHPVLRVEPLAVMFLTVPTELASWRKQAQYDATEEYKDKIASPAFKSIWEDLYLELWESVEAELLVSLEKWTKLSVLIERLEIRSRQIAHDNEMFEQILTSFNHSIQGVYQLEQGDIGTIGEDLKTVANHVASAGSLLQQEAEESQNKISEQFKQYGDVLYSLKSLFDRYHRLGGNSIEQLQKRLEQSKNKLMELNGKPDVKGTEIDRLNDSIARDTKEIAYLTNRDWLIRETMLTEFVIFQETQFQITKAIQTWVTSKTKHSELHSNNWTQLLNALHDMPLARTR